MARVILVDNIKNNDYLMYLSRALAEKTKEKPFEFIIYSNCEPLSDFSAIKNRFPWKSPKLPFQIANWIKKDRPNLAHFQFEFNTYGPFFFSWFFFVLILFVLKLIKIKTVITIHLIIPLGLLKSRYLKYTILDAKNIPRILIRFVLTFFYRMISVLSGKIILHGDFMKEWLVNDYRIPYHKIEVIPHGVQKIQKMESNTRTREKDQPFKVLFFGNIAPRKGLESLLKAFQQLNPPDHYRLLIAGRILRHYTKYGNLFLKLFNESHLENASIIVNPPLEEVHRLYESTDVVVLPYNISVSASGPLSFAIQHHKPVIATNIGIFRETLPNLKGVTLTQVKNSNAIRAAIVELHNDKELYSNYIEYLKKLSETLDWNRIAQKTVDCYISEMLRKSD